MQTGPFRMENNVIASHRADVALFAQKTGDPGNYRQALERAVTDRNNLWWAPAPDRAFGFGFAHETMGDWERWNRTVRVEGSRFEDPMFTDPDNFDFTLKPGSPLRDEAFARLPTVWISPDILAEMRAFHAKYGWEEDYDADLDRDATAGEN